MIFHLESNRFRWRTATVSVLICTAFFFSAPAQAASFVFQSPRVAVSVGKTFTVSVAIDPVGEKQYTVRLIAEFPADKVEVTSFSFASAWLPLSQPEYDLTDNARGVLVKTAGFPKGFSSRESFGVITFRAKQAGETLINVGSSSFILNADSKSTLRSRPQIRVMITKEAATSWMNKALVPNTEEPPTMATSTFEPLPDLPMEEQNLFDIISAPAQQQSVNSKGRIVLFAGLGIITAFGLAFGLGRYRRWRFAQKLKKGKI